MRATAVAVTAIVALTLAGCTPADVVTRTPLDASTAPASSDQASTAAAAPVTSFTAEAVDRFDAPWAMTFLPDSGDLLVTERNGKMWLRDQASGERTEVDGVPAVVVAGQGGLGDIVTGPTFVRDDLVYLSWVEAGAGGTGAVVGRARLTRGTQPALEDLEVIWRQTPKTSGSGHFGHRLAFAPDGASLFVTSGERQKLNPAQDLDDTLGTIVRLTPEGEPWPENPWANAGGVTAEIYSYGHRNPLGIAFAPDGLLWESEMGPQGGDEVNLIEPGGNYGWPLASDGSHYGGADIPDHTAGDGFTGPAVSWNPSISPGSLLIYRGELFAGWTGDALLGALSGEALVRVDLDGRTAALAQTWPMDARIRALAEDADGVIWVLEDAGNGRLLRLTPG